MGADWCLRPPFLSPGVTHQENHTEKTGKEKEGGRNVPEQPVSPRDRTPPLQAWPPTTARTQDLAGPPPRRGACAGAAWRSRAPHPPPEPPSIRHVTPVRLHLRTSSGPSPTWSALLVGRASAWPRPLAPPLPELGPARRGLIVSPPSARPPGFCLNLFPYIQRQKKTFLRGRRFSPRYSQRHI